MSEPDLEYDYRDRCGSALAELAIATCRTVPAGGADLETTEYCVGAAMTGAPMDEWSVPTRRHAFHALEQVEQIAPPPDFSNDEWYRLQRAGQRLAFTNPSPFGGIDTDVGLCAAHDVHVAALLARLINGACYVNVTPPTAGILGHAEVYMIGWREPEATLPGQSVAFLPVVKAMAMGLLFLDTEARLNLSRKGEDAMRLWSPTNA